MSIFSLPPSSILSCFLCRDLPHSVKWDPSLFHLTSLSHWIPSFLWLEKGVKGKGTNFRPYASRQALPIPPFSYPRKYQSCCMCVKRYVLPPKCLSHSPEGTGQDTIFWQHLIFCYCHFPPIPGFVLPYTSNFYFVLNLFFILKKMTLPQEPKINGN